MAVKTGLVVMAMLMTSVKTRLQVQSSKFKVQLHFILMLTIVLVGCSEWDDNKSGFNEQCGECNDIYQCLRNDQNEDVCTLIQDDALCEPPYASPDDPDDSICIKCRKREYSPPRERCALYEITQTIHTTPKKVLTHLMTYDDDVNQTWPCEGCFKHQSHAQTIQVRVFQKRRFTRYQSGFIQMQLRIPYKPSTTPKTDDDDGDTKNAERNSRIENVLLAIFIPLIITAIAGAVFFFMKRRRSTAAGNVPDPENNQRNDSGVENKSGGKKKRPKKPRADKNKDENVPSAVDDDDDDDDDDYISIGDDDDIRDDNEYPDNDYY